MSFASDKLYKGYLRRKMPIIASKVKVREIMAHLPCLTDHDRENIEAKRETYGNHDSMVLLLDCLKRRENWPEQFIAGLEACEQTTLAAEVQAEYDALRGINPPAPSASSPPTTVIRAHVHPAPPAPPAPPAEAAPPAVAAAAAAAVAAPPEPAARASPPLVPVQPQPPLNPAAQVPVAVSPPEPVTEPPQPAQIEVAAPPSTPPPSPEAPHAQVTATPPPQREVNSHQEPVENSESDIQDVLAVNGAIPAPANAGNGEVSISSEVSIDSVAAPPPSGPVEQCETDTPSCPDPLQTTATTTTTTTAADVTPPQSPPPSLTDSDVSDGSSFLTLTPVKPPVQDTTPPLDTKPAAVPQPEETTEPPAAQVVESSPQVEAAAPAPPLPVAAGMNASLWDDDDSVCLSKPGQLVSVPPQNHGGPAHPEPAAPEEPYSGNSGRLEMSEAPASPTISPACSAISSAVSSAVSANTNSALPCQENGISLNHNEPEENQYDSPCQSFDVRENVVQISEEPSILNLDGQSSAPQAQSVNGEAAKEITSVLPPPPPPTNTADTVSSENHHPCQPAPADVSLELKLLQESEEKTPSRNLPANTKYFLTAAGVGACALLMAWKFKN